MDTDVHLPSALRSHRETGCNAQLAKFIEHTDVTTDLVETFPVVGGSHIVPRL